MRNTFNKLVFLLLGLAAVSCANQPKSFNVVVGDAWVDLGNIDEAKGPVKFKTVYVNDSDDSVYVFRTRVSCTCLSVDGYDQNYAAPGEKIIFNLSYDPAYRNGEVEEYAILRLSTREYITVHLKANVTPCVHPVEESAPYEIGEGFYVSHKVLSYVDMHPGETQDIYVHIANDKKSKINVVLEPRGEYSDRIKFRQPGKMAVDCRDTIHFRMTFPEDYSSKEQIDFVLQPIVNGVETEIPIKVRAVPTERK